MIPALETIVVNTKTSHSSSLNSLDIKGRFHSVIARNHTHRHRRICSATEPQSTSSISLDSSREHVGTSPGPWGTWDIAQTDQQRLSTWITSILSRFVRHPSCGTLEKPPSIVVGNLQKPSRPERPTSSDQRLATNVHSDQRPQRPACTAMRVLTYHKPSCG